MATRNSNNILTRRERMLEILYKSNGKDHSKPLNDSETFEDWTPHNIRAIIIVYNKLYIWYYIKGKEEDVVQEYEFKGLLTSDSTDVISAIVRSARKFSNLDEIVVCTGPGKFDKGVILSVLYGANNQDTLDELNKANVINSMMDMKHFLHFYAVDCNYDSLSGSILTDAKKNGYTLYQAIGVHNTKNPNLAIQRNIFYNKNPKGISDEAELCGTYQFDPQYYTLDNTEGVLYKAIQSRIAKYKSWQIKNYQTTQEQKKQEQSKLSVAAIEILCNNTIIANINATLNLFKYLDEALPLRYDRNKIVAIKNGLRHYGKLYLTSCSKGENFAIPLQDRDIFTKILNALVTKSATQKIVYQCLALTDEATNASYAYKLNLIAKEINVNLSSITKDNFFDCMTVLFFMIQAMYSSFIISDLVLVKDGVQQGYDLKVVPAVYSEFANFIALLKVSNDKILSSAFSNVFNDDIDILIEFKEHLPYFTDIFRYDLLVGENTGGTANIWLSTITKDYLDTLKSNINNYGSENDYTSDEDDDYEDGQEVFEDDDDEDDDGQEVFEDEQSNEQSSGLNNDYNSLRQKVLELSDKLSLVHNGKKINGVSVFNNLQNSVLIEKYKTVGIKQVNGVLNFDDCEEKDRAICMECIDMLLTTFCYYCLYSKVHRTLPFARQLLINIYKAKTQQPLYYTKQMVQLINSMIGVTNTDTSSGKDCLSYFATSMEYAEYMRFIDVTNNKYSNLANVMALLSNIVTLSREG